MILILFTAPVVAHTDDGTWESVTSLNEISESGNYYLDGDITLNDETGEWIIPTGKEITLCLNGHIIKQTASNRPVILISGSGTVLNLYDCNTEIRYYFNKDANGLWTLSEDNAHTENSVTGGIIIGGSSVSGGGVCINGGTFNMHGGNIVGNKASSCGGGVYVNEPGTFTLSGGKIIGNIALTDNGYYYTGEGGGVCFMSNTHIPSTAFPTFTMTGGEISDNIAAAAGGVYINGNRAFEMSGGYIKNNNAIDGSGGGVLLDVSTGPVGPALTMTGGEITGNTATSSGGGVKINPDSSFTLSGGSVTYNTVYNNLYDWETYGGGIHMSSGTEFIMNSGTVEYNRAGGGGGGIYTDCNDCTMNGGSIANNDGGYYGGGVYVDSGTLEMNGGSIANNEAGYYGGGVYVGSGNLEMNDGVLENNEAGYCGGGVCIMTGSCIMKEGEITGNSAKGYYGGGVDIEYGNFEMSSGSIANNEANSYGGGVSVMSGSYIMKGGEITGNSANIYGGGVYISGTSTANEISGTVVVMDNTLDEEKNDFYLMENKMINIGPEGLKSGSSIGIATFVTPSAESPVVAVPDTNEGYLKYFFADNTDQHIEYKDGDIVLAAGSPPLPPGCGDVNVTYNNTQRYTVSIPTDMTFPDGRFTLDNEVNVTELWLEVEKTLNISVKSTYGFKMVQGDEATSFIPYTMKVGDAAPFSGTDFNVIAKVNAGTPKVDGTYSLSRLHYTVREEDVAAAKFAGEHKDTLTFKVLVE